MAPWIKKFLEALDEEHRTLLITFFNSRGCMDWCYQSGFFYQLNGPDNSQWPDYFRLEDTNMIVRAVTWWDNEPLWEGGYLDLIRFIDAPANPAASPPEPKIEKSPTSPASTPPPPPPIAARPTPTQKRITVPVDQLVAFSKKALEDSSPTTAIPDAFLQRKAGSVPYLYIDPDRETPYWIGRQEPCDTVINDLSLSRKHCRIESKNGAMVLIDEGSVNGSYVNEQRVESEAPVKPGDLIRVGRAMFILRHTPDKS